MRLLRVELSRLLGRRACLVLLLLGVLGAGLATGGYVMGARPPNAGDIAFAQQMAQRDARQGYYANQVARCEVGTGRFQNRPGFDCQQLLPKAADYLYTPKIDLTGQSLGNVVLPMLLALAIVALLVGATYIGADWSAGTISTLLLFESRRTRVWLAKALSVFVGTAVPAAVAIGLGLLTIVWFGNRWDNITSLDGEIGHLVWVWLRSTVVVGFAALVGFAIVMATRFTAAALGAVLAYALVGEAVLRVVWSGSESWLLSNHVFGFVLGRWVVEVYPSSCFNRCRPDRFVFDVENTGIYLGALAGGALLVSYLVFYRRDVP